MKNLFPNAMQAHDVKGLVIAILVYAIINVVAGFVIGLLAKLPLIGFVFGILGWVIGIYCTAGIIAAILVFFNIIKQEELGI